MNIYEKLQELKQSVASTKINKSGKNKFAGYEYFELQDIMPVIIKECTKLKITSAMAFTPELATLTMYNIEEPSEKVVFSMPTSSANLKGCHEVQNLGAVVTYTRRYLWLTALDITEADVLDTTTGKKDSIEKPKSEVADLTEVKNQFLIAFDALSKSVGGVSEAYTTLGMSQKEVASMAKSGDVAALKKLTSKMSELV